MTLRIKIALTTIIAAFVAVLAAPSALANPTDVTRVAFVGDSIENGYGVPAGDGYLDLFENWIPDQDNVLPIANNGATVRRYLPGGPWYSQLDQLTTWQPTAVVITLGTNEYAIARSTADYQVDLGALVDQVRARVPAARIILIHHYGGYFTPVPGCDNVPGYPPCVAANPPATWAAFGTAMRNVAIAKSTGYIDNSVRYYNWSTVLQADHIHPNATGHDDLFRAIYNDLYYCC